jgi:hypothetical protein
MDPSPVPLGPAVAPRYRLMKQGERLKFPGHLGIGVGQIEGENLKGRRPFLRACSDTQQSTRGWFRTPLGRVGPRVKRDILSPDRWVRG